MKVTVVGAGFAGLTVAHELQKLGFEVVVHERHRHPGGLLGTTTRPHGLVEGAANALLANADVEALFGELGLEFAARKPERTKRFIYWDGPSRWPLSVPATGKLLWRAASLALGQKALMPRKGESIAEWGRRFGGADFCERLLVPGLQGIYAGAPEKLSAVLVLRAAFGGKPARGRFKGSVAPVKPRHTLQATVSLESLSMQLLTAWIVVSYLLCHAHSTAPPPPSSPPHSPRPRDSHLSRRNGTSALEAYLGEPLKNRSTALYFSYIGPV